MVLIGLIFAESILAWRYDLQALGYLYFQGLKLFLWTVVTLAWTAAMIKVSIDSMTDGTVFIPVVAMLLLMLYVPRLPSLQLSQQKSSGDANAFFFQHSVVFIGGFGHAYNCFYENVKSVGESESESETSPLLVERTEF